MRYGPPLAAPGGLAARSARGAIGEQWWSRRFVAVLESFALGTRLTRGRAYARKGQVLSLEVAPGLVSATVQGSRPAPYRVEVALAPFPELVWARAEVALAEQALCSAQLLAGEMPPELEQVLGVPLFPERLSDLVMSCSCPDFAVPCKHVAATFYLLAESFDDDPFRILAWRGRERPALLARLRELRGGAVATGGGPAGRQAGSLAALAGLALATAALWEAAAVPPLPAEPELPADLLLRQLPAPPAGLGGPRVARDLQALYGQLAAGPG